MNLGMKTYFLKEYVDFLYLNNVQDLTNYIYSIDRAQQGKQSLG